MYPLAQAIFSSTSILSHGLRSIWSQGTPSNPQESTRSTKLPQIHPIPHPQTFASCSPWPSEIVLVKLTKRYPQYVLVKDAMYQYILKSMCFGRGSVMLQIWDQIVSFFEVNMELHITGRDTDGALRGLFH